MASWLILSAWVLALLIKYWAIRSLRRKNFLARIRAKRAIRRAFLLARLVILLPLRELVLLMRLALTLALLITRSALLLARFNILWASFFPPLNCSVNHFVPLLKVLLTAPPMAFPALLIFFPASLAHLGVEILTPHPLYLLRARVYVLDSLMGLFRMNSFRSNAIANTGRCCSCSFG